ncbi:MAG: divergent PAP2 family protein [Lachnospiraceae bacterium]|nr:divergent PAP2 family protein [Lachnospiraceae bacterium]MDE6744231.1 divergent PAP2 family protein [Lachnospiraceae bacterium]
MNYLIGITKNEILLSAVAGWFTAQVLKTLLHVLVTKSFDPERLVGTGGMPSSHSATVCGLATAVGINYGTSGIEFALAFTFAIIVMYDALGVRRETGKQAKILNEMIGIFNNMGTKMSTEDRLKEFVGHTPFQVIVGALIGFGIATAVCNLI